MKKVLFSIIATICAIGVQSQTKPVAIPDTVEFTGTTAVKFNIVANDKGTFTFTQFNFNCVKYGPSANTTTTPRTISGVGKLLLKLDGTGTFTPVANYQGGVLEYTIANNCGQSHADVVFKLKKVVVPPVIVPPIEVPPVIIPPIISESPSNTSGPSFTSSSYNWGRTIGNSSSVQYGPSLIRGLRSPTGITESNGHLYITTGLVEGNSGIMKVPVGNPTTMTIVDKPIDGDFVMNSSHVCSYNGIVYMAGYDSYGAVTSAVVAYQNDKQYIFAQGKAFQCKWQANPYKSGIHINKAFITGLDVDVTLLYVYCGNVCYQYDRLSGAFKSQVTIPKVTYIAKAVSGANGLEMTTTDVRYNGKVICKAQTGIKCDNYTYSPKDFNDYSIMGSVAIGPSGLWIVDKGNARVLHYDLDGKYINQIAYIPMNYNCAVDRNDPSRVFASHLEFKVTYPSMKWQLVKNWSYALDTNYLPQSENLSRDLFRDVITTSTGTFAFVNYILRYWDKGDDGKIHMNTQTKPVLMKLTETGVVKQKEFDWFANVHITSDGKIAEFQLDNNKATFYLDGVLKETITVPSNSALVSNAAKIGYTTDGYFVVYNPNKEHTGFHLAWVKGGKIINGMPTKKTVADDQVYPYGDYFCVDEKVEYAGAYRVYVVGTKVFVNYVGEFYGGSGGQTNLWFEYEAGTFIKRVGKTSWEAVKIDGEEAPRETAGNSYGGGVVLLNDKYYIITNCEHTGAIQWFEVYR